MKEKLVDSNSPVGVLEDYFKSSSESEESSSCSKESSEACSSWNSFLKLLRITRLMKKPPLDTLLLSRRRMSRSSSSMREIILPSLDSDSSFQRSPWKVFTQLELQIATNNFSQENLIGKGGYGDVYKGCLLPNNQLVAIKRLRRGTEDECIGDFLSELGIMVHLNHPNTAKLVGYGVDGGLHLVLQFSQKGSLASLLYNKGCKELPWCIRKKIAIETGEGILYLHEGCQRRIIHRDIKAANILLSDDFESQICDFGLAKWLPENWTHHTVSKFEGTFGYLAPEYLLHGIVDEKTDVFAFGVLLLELVTGRRALDFSQHSLLLWAKPLLKRNKIRELIDPSLGDEFECGEINVMLLTASLCIQQSSIRRPSMRQVVQLLTSNSSSCKFTKCLFG